MSFITSWLWPAEAQPMRATEASQSTEIRNHFIAMLDNTDPPKTFSPRKVAEMLSEAELSKLGYKTWQDAIPAIYELTWELRAFGDLIIICKGKVLPEDVMFYDVEAPIKIMRQEL